MIYVSACDASLLFQVGGSNLIGLQYKVVVSSIFVDPWGRFPCWFICFKWGGSTQHRCWCTSRPRSFRFCTWCILVATRLSNIAPFPSWWCWYWDQLECRRWGYGDQITGWFHWVGVEINYWSGHHWSKVSTKQPSRSCPYQLSQQNQDFGNHLNRWLWRSGWVASAQIWLPCHLKLLAGFQSPCLGKLVGAVQNLTLTIDMSDCWKCWKIREASEHPSEICWILVESRWRCFTARSFLVFPFLWWVPLLGRRKGGL